MKIKAITPEQLLAIVENELGEKKEIVDELDKRAPRDEMLDSSWPELLETYGDPVRCMNKLIQKEGEKVGRMLQRIFQLLGTIREQSVRDFFMEATCNNASRAIESFRICYEREFKKPTPEADKAS